MGNNADSLELLAVVATVHHDRVGQTLNDGALSLAETLSGIATGSVREVDRGANLDVVAVCPLVFCLQFLTSHVFVDSHFPSHSTIMNTTTIAESIQISQIA